MNEVENWYDNEYDEWSRLDRHKVEFEITKRYMDRYITGKALKILDIGGGPGRYSFYLAGKGHQTTLLDLSQHHIDVAKEKSKDLGIDLVDYVKGNALDLSAFKEESFDVVLLMGPLYHLTREEDRRKALKEALRLLKKDGIILASFISKYAPLNESIIYQDLNGEEGNVTQLLCYLENGENQEDLGFTTAYFTGAEEAEKFMTGQGLLQLAFAGVENVIGYIEKDIVNLDKKQFDQYLEIAYALSQDKNLMGTGMHFLYVGQK